MKTLGIIGGMGPESTIEYYRAILVRYRERSGNTGSPSIVIDSIDVDKVLRLIAANDLAAVTDYLCEEPERLANAGASLAILAANTPHIVFDDLVRRSPVPMVSIVEAAADAARDLGLKRVGLLGTEFTMRGQFYPTVFAAHGIDVVVPADDEQAYIHDKYTAELLRHVLLPRTRDGLFRIVERMKERDRIDAVILGGTELPLILHVNAAAGVPMLDTTQIHARAAVDRLWPSDAASEQGTIAAGRQYTAETIVKRPDGLSAGVQK
jgi:aspartate racemase